jgi:phosphatidylglycerol---prolipoprotein diacylglyceryl transferase
MTQLFSYIQWNVAPEIFQVGAFAIRWYGLLFALMFLFGFFMLRWEFRVEGKNEKDVERLLTFMVVGTLVGARLVHCLFYDPVYYWQHPLEIPAIWEGGLASHGGALGILIALYFYTRSRPDQGYIWLLDRVVIPAALGSCLVRVGNLFNSEILGVPTQVPWAFVFQRVDSVPRHPAQLYEAIAYGIIFIILFQIYRRLRERTPKGLLFGLFLVSVFTARFLLEFLKQPQASYEEGFRISVGQWLSVPFVVWGAFLLRGALRERKEVFLEHH